MCLICWVCADGLACFGFDDGGRTFSDFGSDAVGHTATQCSCAQLNGGCVAAAAHQHAKCTVLHAVLAYRMPGYTVLIGSNVGKVDFSSAALDM